MGKCNIKHVDDTVAIMSLALERTIIGRVRLQKTFFLLELADVGVGFDFTYKHYGPYCDELSNAVDVACAFGLVKEERKVANWGGVYSIFTIKEEKNVIDNDNATGRRELVELCTGDDIASIPLELAATAAYLKYNGESDPWKMVKYYKWDKVSKIEQAKELYNKICKIETKRPLPEIVNK